MSTFDFAGKTILIAGTSVGVGGAFACELARRGATLMLVSRNEAKLVELASKFDRVHFYPTDLNAAGAVQHLADVVAAKGLEVDVLINNAGFCVAGTFGDLAPQATCGESNANVDALAELVHVFLPMIERRQGGIIQVAPLAACHPSPYMAVYGAFVLAFSEALFAEYRPRGVRVLSLSLEANVLPVYPPPSESAKILRKAEGEHIVRVALEAFVAGRSSFVHSIDDNVVTFLSRHLSRELSAKMVARVARSKGAFDSRASHRERLREPTLPKIAAELDMSPRTLQRKLKEHGRSFNSVIDDVRRDLATRHLADESFNLDDLSFLLGFSNISAFHRAFKRWTGDAPGAYRRRVHTDDFQKAMRPRR